MNAKQLHQAYKDSSYYKFLPARVEDATEFIKTHKEECEQNSTLICVEYFYEWMLDRWCDDLD